MIPFSFSLSSINVITKTKYSVQLLCTLYFSCALIQCKDKEVIIPPGVIASISPNTGQQGTIVKIRGSNFSKNPSENLVKFNNVKAEVINAYDTLLEVRAPSSSSGTVEISVRNEKVIGPEFKYYNIYCYGGNFYYAGYWKDGVATKLSSRGYIYDLAISGQDVYAVGFDSGDPSNIIPRYWKNGQPVELEGLTIQNKLTGIVVSGQDVYICGIQYLPYPAYKIAKYWKNGKLIFSSKIYDYVNAKVNDIAVDGNDVYMVGSEYPKAMLWKNGTSISLSDGTRLAEATRLRIIGSTVHIIGGVFLDPVFTNPNSIVYWKDGTITNIKGGLSGVATDFAISGSNIFVTGYESTLQGQKTSKTIAKYWRNGIENPLSDGSVSRYGSSIEVTDDAIYVLTNQFGQSNIDSNIYYPYSSVLLKNGTPMTPDYGPGVTGSIFGILVVYY